MDPGHGPAVHAHTFETVYDEWFHEMCRWLRAYGVPAGDLEDIAQEAFLVVRRKLDGFDGKNLAGWLYRIGWRTASDRRRRAWLRHLVFGLPATLAGAAAPASAKPDVAFERVEAQRLVARGLDRLGDKYRRALVLFEIEGCSLSEIAVLEDVPVTTVKNRLHRARMAFRRFLEKTDKGRGS